MKDDICFMKSTFIRDPNATYHFCCQDGHMQNNCYVKKNMKLGMKRSFQAKQGSVGCCQDWQRGRSASHIHGVEHRHR